MNRKEIIKRTVLILGLTTAACDATPPISANPSREIDPEKLLVLESHKNNMDYLNRKLNETQALDIIQRISEERLTAFFESNSFIDIDWELCQGFSSKVPIAGATGKLDWPVYGPIYTYFSSWHQGLDISPNHGTPVKAADGGIVLSRGELKYGFGHHLVGNLGKL